MYRTSSADAKGTALVRVQFMINCTVILFYMLNQIWANTRTWVFTKYLCSRDTSFILMSWHICSFCFSHLEQSFI